MYRVAVPGTGYFAVEAVTDVRPSSAVAEAVPEGSADAEALADALAEVAAVLADALAEPLADADAEGWEELEPHALSPRAAAGTTPSSRVRRLRGEVVVVPLSRVAGWPVCYIVWLINLWLMCTLRCCQPPWV